MSTVTRVVVTCDTVYPSWGPCLSTWSSTPERIHHVQVAYDLRKAKWLTIDGVHYCPLHHPLPGQLATGSTSEASSVTETTVPYLLPPDDYVPPIRCTDCWARIFYGPVVGGHLWQHLNRAHNGHLVRMRDSGWFDTRTGQTRHDLGMGA